MNNSNVEFITIPSYRSNTAPKHYSAYAPVILMDGEYDNALGFTVGKSISLEPMDNMKDATEKARLTCLSTCGAIGYTVKGVDYE